MSVYSNVLEMIGNTPMLEFTHLDTGPCRLFAKLEYMNPGGSVKDRIGLYMLREAERRGDIKPGDTVIEATAGNTGIGLALAAAQMGYRLILFIPDKMSQEKIFNVKAMGAEVVLTRSDVGKGHPEYYQELAATRAQEMGAYFINQFSNSDNVKAHENTTGPEIWEQMDHSLDAVVLGVGSSGTLTGVGHYLNRVAPHVDMVLADPAGSVLSEYVRTGKLGEKGTWLVEGIGEDFIPSIGDLSRVETAYSIPDGEAFMTAREVLSKEGILLGSSSGTLIAAALRYCREQTEAKRVVTLGCDTGNKYLSKLYNDFWLIDQGFIEREHYGDLRDFVGRPHDVHATVTAGAKDTLLTAHNRMRTQGFSQVPVLDGDRLLGVVTESDIIRATSKEGHSFETEVEKVMDPDFPRIGARESKDRLMTLLETHHSVALTDGARFLGLITRSDVLNYYRRHR